MSRYFLATTLLSAFAALPSSSEARLSTGAMYSEDHFGYWGISCDDIRDLDTRCCGVDLTQCTCPVRTYDGWGSSFIQSWWDSKCTYLDETIVKCDNDIPNVAINTQDEFDTLVQALVAADLVGALSFPNGPFTVFAPTDAAFGALDPALLDCLLLEKNVDILTDVLTYHVVAGAKVLSTDLSDNMMVPTLNGQNITVTSTTPNVVINNDSTVTTPDVDASNGVIHVIDAVLVPPNTVCVP